MATSNSLTIVNGDWGATSLRAIGAVLESAAAVLCGAFGRRADAPIRVAPWRNRPPQVFHDRRPYEIQISARDTYWCQYVYQFSHELCHVLVNFDHVRGHRHKWFEESLCELAALFVLRRLPAAWRGSPPSGIVDAADFAPHFGTYAEYIASLTPPVDPSGLPAWLSGHMATLEADPFNRELNRVVATALLEHFLDDPSLWRDCGWLNGWTAAADRSFADHLDSWAGRLHEHGLVGRTPELVRTTFFVTGAAREQPSPPLPARHPDGAVPASEAAGSSADGSAQ